jgi:hypothetical protein
MKRAVAQTLYPNQSLKWEEPRVASQDTSMRCHTVEL